MHNQYFYQSFQMRTFRKKYVYNPDNPVYESETARTYNCMNTETKDKKLIIIQHLIPEPPFVQPSSTILQPIQIPTSIQPFSVYPIVHCVSQIGKVSQPEAMYVLKCILQSKIKKPLYCVISSQGICCSEVQGILPSKSPDIFQLAIDLLDLPPNLQQVEKSIVSKEGYAICRALKNGDNPLSSIQNYGWRDLKKQREQVYDDDFVVFKGRRKEEGPFGQQYGLAWNIEHGLCRLKFISLTKDTYEEQFFKQFLTNMDYVREQNKAMSQKQLFLQIHKYQKDERGIKIFTEIANQGNLSEYISKKYQLNQSLNELNTINLLDSFISNMFKLSNSLKSKGLGTLHIKNFYVHNNRICLGQPQFITDKGEKKLRQLKNTMDYYAPELKQNIILPENLTKLSRQKMDVWTFGLILHKIYVKQVPLFDPSKKPILSKQKLSPSMLKLISSCLDLTPANRPSWGQINMKQVAQKTVIIEQVVDSKQDRQQIKLGSRSQNKSQRKSPSKKSRIVEQLGQQPDKNKEIQQEKIKLKEVQEEEEVPYVNPLPTQISSRLKIIKLIIKTVAIMLLYLFVFFRVFFGNTFLIIAVRSFYTTATLKLVDYASSTLSTVTVITNDALFFLKNDISFSQIQEKYQCINDKFDPVYNPSYSLLTFVHSADFLILILCGWGTALLICCIKAISIWKGGISNRPNKKRWRYWVIYGFYELTIAGLLFAHFYIFQFFYFAGATPCLNITSFSGIQPFFDSSLFLFLQNTSSYFQQVFSTLGVLALFLLFSSCFYAWGPKLDQKYFISVPSILFRIIPLILFLLICRIGVFTLFSPTAINDTTQMLPAIIKNSFQGFIGIIPEVFILITLAAQILIELVMFWCEKRAAQSDELAKMFNTKDKKLSVSQSNDVSGINDMSIINNSKHKLQLSDADQL